MLYLLLFKFRISISCIIIITARIMSRYAGKSEIEIYCAIRPKRGGIVRKPIYAKAICTPIIA